MAEYYEKKGMSPFTTGIIGAIVGAGTALAAVFLSDKKNRKELRERMEDIKEKTREFGDKIKSRSEEEPEKTKKAVKEKEEETLE